MTLMHCTAAGHVVSYCSSGRWTAAAGTCQPDTSICYGLPEDVPGTDGWSIDNCFNTEGGFCVAECTLPTVGAPLSFCSQGVWSKPVGGCWTPGGKNCSKGKCMCRGGAVICLQYLFSSLY
jgi:hypothetical protein